MRYGRREHRSRGTDGVFPVFRMEEFVLRRSARAREGCGGVLHGAESDHDAVVLILIGLLLFQQPAFEVASLKPTPPQTPVVGELSTYPGRRVLAIHCNLEYF